MEASKSAYRVKPPLTVKEAKTKTEEVTASGAQTAGLS